MPVADCKLEMGFRPALRCSATMRMTQAITVAAKAHGSKLSNWPLWVLTAVTTVVVWRTKTHLLWLVGAGCVLGALGLV